MEPDRDPKSSWADPNLGRMGFQPTVIVSATRIIPAIDESLVLDRLDDTAASLDAWRLRATRRDVDDRGRTTSDTLGECRSGDHSITVSTITTVWEDAGTTILRQLVVTTFTDQLPMHSEILRALH